MGLRLRRDQRTVQGHGPLDSPGPLPWFARCRPRTREGRPLSRSIGLFSRWLPVRDFERAVGAGGRRRPSQARTTHAAFSSLSGSRRHFRRAPCQLGASGRDGDVNGRYIVRRPLRQVPSVVAGVLQIASTVLKYDGLEQVTRPLLMPMLMLPTVARRGHAHRGVAGRCRRR